MADFPNPPEEVGTRSTPLAAAASGYKVKGLQHVDVTWSGATSAAVDIVRDGTVVVTTADDGAYTDSNGARGGGSYSYEVCESGTSTCSAPVQVVF